MSTVNLAQGNESQERLQPAHRGLSQRTVLTIYLLFAALCGFVHLLLGANYLVVLAAVGSAIVSTLPALRYGWRDLPSLLSLLFGVRYATSALVYKLYEFSALDQGLYAPLESFYVVLIGTTATTLAVFIARLLWPKRPVFSEQLNAHGYAFLLITGAALTVLAVAGNLTETETLGGIRALLLDGLIILPMAYMGYNIYTSKTMISPGLLAVLLLWMLLSFSFNSRQGGVTMILSLLVMYIGFGFRITTRMAVFGGCLAVFFLAIISPAIIDARAFRESATPLDMIGHTIDAVHNRLTGEAVEAAPVDPAKARYNLYYVNADNTFLGRAVSVQQLDFLVALAASHGVIGIERFWDGLVELLPAYFVPDKTIATRPGYALTVYGIYSAGTENRIEVTPYGSAFSYGGFEFLFFSILASYSVVFFLIRMFCPTFQNSIFAAFVLVAYMHPLSAGDIFAPYGILRTFPFEAVIFWLAHLISGSKARS